MNFLMMKNMVFFSQKIDGNMIFTDCWKVLVLIFSGIGNIVFFESRSWWKDDIYWLLRSSYFELFDDGKYSLFFSENVDGKMIFTWSFWAWEIWFFAQWKCTEVPKPSISTHPFLMFRLFFKNVSTPMLVLFTTLILWD